MTRILIKAGTLPANSEVTIDGIGSVTVGHWTEVTEEQERLFLAYQGRTVAEAFEGSETVQTEASKQETPKNTEPKAKNLEEDEN